MFRKACEIIDRIITVFETVFLTLSLTVMAGALFAEVAGGLFGVGPAWAGELAMYLMVWVMCVGSSAATRGGRHIAITVLRDRLRGRPAAVVRAAVRALCIVFCAGLCYVGADYALMAYRLGQRSVALNVPLWIVYSALPVAAALMAVRFALPGAAPKTESREHPDGWEAAK